MRPLFAAAAALVLLSATAVCQQLPEGFLDEILDGDWNQPVGLTIDASGRLVGWEKAGLVYLVEDTAADHAEVFLDITEEVGNWTSHGLMGFALDPDFLLNGYVYLLYAVDRHHLDHFGTPEYDPDASESFVPTVGRVTRFTAHGPELDHADPDTRFIVLGGTPAGALPLVHSDHSVGHLAFGEDGSLFVSCGDAASPVGPDVGGTPEALDAIADGLLQPKEAVGSFRAQLIDSLAGKLLRLDPTTGKGMPDNPFFDPLEPRAARSRIWAYGLRNPFRFEVVPGTGGARDPGTVLIGDVGEGAWEELSVCRDGGENLGWPIYEGLELEDVLSTISIPNQDAPNPLFGQPLPGGGVCEQAFFHFDELLAEDHEFAPTWPANACDPAAPIPSEWTSVHTRPALDWKHIDGPARTPIFAADGSAQAEPLGSRTSPVAGAPFAGSCSIGGAWYSGNGYPADYRNSYFHADFVEGWMHHLVFDDDMELFEVRPFGTTMGPIIAMATHPVSGDLHYIRYSSTGQAKIHGIRFVEGNLPPVAVADLDVSLGAEPLVVQFDAGASVDPEGLPLSFTWDFGDGTPVSRVASPKHIFPTEDISDEGTPIALVYELDPPQGAGPPPIDPEVVRDGVYPPIGTTVIEVQWISAYFGTDDKNGLDWFGYEFPGPRTFHGLVFQEAHEFSNTGGWFEDLAVQVRSSGVWHDVPGAEFTPPYDGRDGITYEVHEARFAPVVGDAIRIAGTPGGNAEYVSIAELRVLAAPLVPLAQPLVYPITLTVTDAVASTDTTTQTVWVNNTAPEITITSPLQGQTYDPLVVEQVPLTAEVFDAEHDLGSLDCEWQVILHHDDHTHPEPFLEGCTGTATLLPHGSAGDAFFFQVDLTVTDPLGLATTITHYLQNETDCNLNGFDDALDLAAGILVDHDGDGIADACQRDCDGDGLVDAFQIALGLARDLDGNQVPDACQEHLTLPAPPQGQPAPGPPN